MSLLLGGPGLKLPAAGSSLTVTQNGSVRNVGLVAAGNVTEDLVLGSTVADRKIVVIGALGCSGPGSGRTITCNLDPSGANTPVTVTEVFDADNGNHGIVSFHFDAASSGTYRITIAQTGAVDFRDMDYLVLEAVGATTIDAPSVATATSPATFDLSDTVATGDYVAATCLMGNRGTTGDFTWTNLTEIYQASGASTREVAIAFNQVATGDSPLSMSVETTGDSDFASLAGLVHIA